MCGIFGYTDTNILENNFFKLMSHRGPDAKGTKKTTKWTVGHLRLSIIDLDSSSNQPFEDDGSILVYNGEIYNFLELKNKYLLDHRFRTKSDTEVLLALLNKFGLDILDELNGMFAFAFINKNNELFLVRDRFGVKPVYYTIIDQNFFFAARHSPFAGGCRLSAAARSRKRS